MRDIAKLAGVTHATVSLALRDDPRITKARREQIKRIAIEHGYRPDPLLSQLATYRKASHSKGVTSALAWINAWEPASDFLRHKEFAKYYEGASAMAASLGFRLEIFNVRELKMTSKRLGSILSTRGVRGILIPPHNATYETPDVEWNEFAVLRIGFSQPATRRHVVGSDQYEGGRIAAKGILDAGYRRIGFVSDSQLEAASRSNFSAGFHSVRDRHIPTDARVPELVFELPLRDDACAEFGRWIERHRVDAVFFRLATVPSWTERLGYTIGRDLGLAGTSFHDSGVDSGLDQKPYEIGSVAVQFLSSLITHREFGVPRIAQRLMISPSWALGSSLGHGRR